MVRLSHACICNAALTPKAEWQRLAKEAIKEHDRVVAENYKLKQIIANFGPKFQGMTEIS